MGEALPLPIASYRLPSSQASSARLLNCYTEQAPKDARKQPSILRRACGISAWGGVDSTAVSVRGMHVMADQLYAVIGASLYSISDTGAATELASIPGVSRVSMSDNGSDLVTVDPITQGIYAYNGTLTTLSETATKVGYLDGYFVFLRPDTRQVFNSGINSTSLDPLDVFSAEATSGDLLGLMVDGAEIILTKETASEVWYDAANDTGSPFSRSPDGRIKLGTAAADSLCQQDNSPLWLANDKTFRRLQSATPSKISQYGIDAQVQRLSVISDCFGFDYSLDGHLFVCWTFPAAGRTFVYDCATEEWHERSSYNLGRWRANCAINAYGMQLAGDCLTGRIGILDPDVFTEWDDDQVCEWDYQSVYAQRNRLSHRRFELCINTGDATIAGQGSDPVATLMVSDDGGRTFRIKPTRSLGLMGQYKARVHWENLGTSRERVYRIQVSDPVPLFTVDTQIETEGRRG